MMENSQDFHLDCMTDENWLKRLVYLADIFGALNFLYFTLQDKDLNLLCKIK